MLPAGMFTDFAASTALRNRGFVSYAKQTAPAV